MEANIIEPQVNAGGGPQTPNAASLLVRVLPDNPVTELSSYQKLIEDEVQPALVRIPGVSQVFLAGEQPRELHVTFGSFNALFIYPQDPNRIEQMIGIVRDEVLIDLHDTQAFVQRSSLLNFGFDGGRTISVDLQGPDTYVLSEVATSAMGIISEAVPVAQVRPIPGLAIAEPELQLAPNDRRITAAGLNHSTVANIVRAMTSGTFVGEYSTCSRRRQWIS